MATYTVATPKGGVGKSTTAAELVLALSQRGRKVLAIDLDQQGNLTNRLGLTASSEVDGTAVTFQPSLGPWCRNLPRAR